MDNRQQPPIIVPVRIREHLQQRPNHADILNANLPAIRAYMYRLAGSNDITNDIG